MALVVWLTIRLASPINAHLKDEQREIMTRLSGIVLMAISFQLLVRGLTELTLTYGLEILAR